MRPCPYPQRRIDHAILIPMRGNEPVCGTWATTVPAKILIPMRGNELTVKRATTQIQKQILIPMRGNEYCDPPYENADTRRS